MGPASGSGVVVRKLLFFMFVVGLLLAAGSAAFADTVTINLSIASSSVSGFKSDFTGDSFGTVTVTTPTLNSNTATITYTANTSGVVYGGQTYVFLFSGDSGGNSIIAIEPSSTLKSPFTSVSSQALSGTAPTVNPYWGSGGVDSLGSFDQSNASANSSDLAYQISFTITDNTGTWANAASVLTSSGNDVATTVYACVKSTDSSCTTGNAFSHDYVAGTGYITPEPSTLLLWGTGLLALGAIFRKKLGVGPAV